MKKSIRQAQDKHFYTHLIEIEPILTTLDEVVITDAEKKELLTIVERTTHYAVINVVLGKLKNEDKKQFISHVAKDEHDKIWELLSKKTKDIEKKIKNAVRDIHLSMIDDVKKITRKQTRKKPAG
ncbi:hypothetical protein A2690_02100 [Candidatus Roizmanbacteria bacterium RIFCSPHIGHO2_01_FULL_39_12b]|uniref:Uncharacterized protein n=1 Tax=Candidatus Roizmanbacteria bacterium RIFCSPHIGHO2_01_FULL_39_12b TaxID=1802030 RepID=A0A1F7GE62_9BACT|nr:MAG: hypothetical protein A2690_02100 [Candidatus Roizmanbacteria bacterium RIFCSPHIGHO2_01_FULL_39_12b]OGK46321.1 MAG: hypothetical protein A3B46_00070 [Candidatus Roizmanbacteria bacterium RIFCSPLOWO2_01_FULL_39_19]